MANQRPRLVLLLVAMAMAVICRYYYSTRASARNMRGSSPPLQHQDKVNDKELQQEDKADDNDSSFSSSLRSSPTWTSQEEDLLVEPRINNNNNNNNNGDVLTYRRRNLGKKKASMSKKKDMKSGMMKRNSGMKMGGMMIKKGKSGMKKSGMMMKKGKGGMKKSGMMMKKAKSGMKKSGMMTTKKSNGMMVNMNKKKMKNKMSGKNKTPSKEEEREEEEEEEEEENEEPRRTAICDSFRGNAYGWCVAFCQAQDCATQEPDYNPSCASLYDLFVDATGQYPPCTTTQQFIEASWTSGSEVEEETSFQANLLDGALYQVTYSGTLHENGVMSLTALTSPFVESVECSLNSETDDAVVDIIFSGDMDADALAVLFPMGSFLAVDSAAFGPCDFGSFPEDLSEAQQQRLRIKDGFIVIKSVSGTSKKVTVSGSPASYFFLFDQGSISLRRLQDEDDGDNLDGRRRELTTISHTVEKKKTFKPFSGLKINTSISATLEAGVENFDVDFGFLSGIELSADLFYSASVSAELDVAFAKKIKGNKEVEFFSIVIFGLPNIPLFKKLKLPSLKIGGYFEAPFIAQFEASIESKMNADAKWVLASGRKEMTYKLAGEGWSSLVSSVEEKENTPVTNSEKSFGIPDDYALSAEAEFKAEGFIGFKPQLALYFSDLGEAILGVPLGIGVKGVLRTPPLSLTSGGSSAPLVAFDPYKKDNPNDIFPIIKGKCDTCHFMETNIGIEVLAAEVFAQLSFKYESTLIDIDISTGPFEFKIEGTEFFEEFFKWCLIGSETLVCGNKCCYNCDEWIKFEDRRDDTWVSVVESKIPCPCDTTGLPNEVLELSNVLLAVYHPGADECYRGDVTIGENKHGQQCCYSDGALLTSGPGAGSLDKESSSVRENGIPIGHFTEDVIPFFLCGGAGGWEKYALVRPIPQNSECEDTPSPPLPPPPAPSTPPLLPLPSPGPGGGGGSPGGSGGGYVGGIRTDPHLTTFDQTRFSCQVAGEVIASKSRVSDFEIQARFKSVGEKVGTASVTTALVSRVPGYSQIQISIPSTLNIFGDIVGTCPVSLYADGVLKNLGEDTSDIAGVVFKLTFDGIVVLYENGVSWAVRFRRGCGDECFFTFTISLTEAFVLSEAIVGLLGTPNRDGSDDFTAVSGGPYEFTSRDTASIYEYCSSWCTEESNSLFAYEPGFQHSSFDSCSAKYASEYDIDFILSNASPELRDICGNSDLECLLDGLVCGIQTARDSRVDLEEVLFLSALALQNESSVSSTSPSTAPSQTMGPTPAPTAIPTTPPATNAGRDFIFAELPNPASGPTGIAIVNVGNSEAKVDVFSERFSTLESRSIHPGEISTVLFPQSYILSTGVSRSNPPIYRVASDEDIVVYIFLPISAEQTNDASLIIPVTALGTEYFVSSHEGRAGNYRGSMFGVVATENNTVVRTIDTSGVLVDDVVLNEGEYLQRIQDFPLLTGWQIESSRPVAAFSGTRCTSAGSNSGFCDILYEMLIPKTAMASNYVACPGLTRPVGCSGAGCSPDIYQIIATEDNTEVVFDPPSIGSSLVLNKGQSFEYETNEPHTISAGKAVSFHQILVSTNSGFPVASIGDPSLILVAPTAQFLSSNTYLTPTSSQFDFITVTYPQGAFFNLDGGPLDEVNFKCPDELIAGTIGGETYCCASIRVGDGAHTIESDKKFGLVVTGFDNAQSYGYTGGLGLSLIQ